MLRNLFFFLNTFLEMLIFTEFEEMIIELLRELRGCVQTQFFKILRNIHLNFTTSYYKM